MASGKHHEALWQNLAEQVGGRFHDEKGWSGDRVTASVDDWTVTVDLHPLPGWHMQQILLRLRAPIVNRDRFRFEIHRNGPLAQLADLTGLDQVTTDIKVGDDALDRLFTIHSNKPDKVRQLLARPRLAELLRSAGDARLEIRRHDGDLGAAVPPEVDIVRLETAELVRDMNTLRLYYTILAETLEGLTEIGTAAPPPADVKL